MDRNRRGSGGDDSPRQPSRNHSSPLQPAPPQPSSSSSPTRDEASNRRDGGAARPQSRLSGNRRNEGRSSGSSNNNNASSGRHSLASNSNSHSHSSPPVPIPPSSTANLRSFERDVIAKSTGRPSDDARSTVPGAVAVSGQVPTSPLSSANTSKSSGHIMSTSSGDNLTRLEQDVVAKSRVRPAGGARPGAYSVPAAGSDANGLSQLERDVATKAAQRTSIGGQPGAVSVPGNAGSLRQLEHDIAAKTGGVGSYSIPATHSDTMKSPPNYPNQQHPSRPGAVAVPGNPDSLFQIEQEMLSKAQPAAGAYNESRLNQLEQDLMAKAQSSSGGGHRPGAVPSSSSLGRHRAAAAASLHNLEEQVAAKVAGSDSAGNHINNNNAGYGDNRDGLSQLERELMSMHGQQMPQHPSTGGGAAAAASMPHSNQQEHRNLQTMQYLEDDVVAKMAANMSVAIGTLQEDPVVMDSRHYNNSDTRSLEDDAGNTDPLAILRDGNMAAHEEDDYHDSFASRDDENPSDALSPENNNGSPSTSDDPAEGSRRPNNQVEAFVADTVIAATSAFVVDGRADKYARLQRLKKMAAYAFLFVLIVVAVVVAVILTQGKDSDSSNGSGAIGDENTPRSAPPSPMPQEAAPSPPTIAPTSALFALYLGHFYPVYDDDELFRKMFVESKETPQYKAAKWLFDVDEVSNVENGEVVGLLQRYALATFYYHFSGDDWTCSRLGSQCTGNSQETPWLQPNVDECNWLGVDCGDGTEVLRLILPPHDPERNDGFILDGTLPLEMVFLKDLIRFSAPYNQLRGSFPPSWEGMTSLKILRLEQNALEGPFPSFLIKNNPELDTLQLQSNQLTGNIPDEIGTLPLRDVRLGDNKLEGEIPDSLWSIPTLQKLDLSNNLNLQASIPAVLFENSNLNEIDVRYNPGITGAIPSNVGLFAVGMTLIGFGHTGMDGPIPASLYNLRSLITLDLSSANFNGSLSESFANFEDIQELSLDNNEFTGPIPQAFDGLTSLRELELIGNDLTGTISAVTCDQRGIKEDDIQVLTADCDGVDAPVSCDCCTMCKQQN